MTNYSLKKHFSLCGCNNVKDKIRHLSSISNKIVCGFQGHMHSCWKRLSSWLDCGDSWKLSVINFVLSSLFCSYSFLTLTNWMNNVRERYPQGCPRLWTSAGSHRVGTSQSRWINPAFIRAAFSFSLADIQIKPVPKRNSSYQMTIDHVFTIVIIIGYGPFNYYMSFSVLLNLKYKLRKRIPQLKSVQYVQIICAIFHCPFFSEGSSWMDLVGEDDELFGVNDVRSRKVVEKLAPEEWKLSFPPQLNTSFVS